MRRGKELLEPQRIKDRIKAAAQYRLEYKAMRMNFDAQSSIARVLVDIAQGVDKFEVFDGVKLVEIGDKS